MEKIIDYINQCLALGLTRDAIDIELVRAGWSDEEITIAWTKIPAPKPIETSETQESQGILGGFLDRFRFSHKFILIAGITVGVLILGAGGVFAYSQFASSPEKIWEQAIQNTRALQSGHLKISGSYTDNLASNAQVELNGDFFGNVENLSITIRADVDLRNAQSADPDFAVNGTAGFNVAGFSVGADFEARKVAKNLYYKIRNNFLGVLLGEFGSAEEQQSDWLKIDLSAAPADAGGDATKKFSEAQIQELRGVLGVMRAVKMDKLIGKEMQNDEEIYHYQASVDREALSSGIQKIIDILGKNAAEPIDPAALMGKFEIRKLEVWVSKKDKQIQRIALETTMPSIMARRFAALEVMDSTVGVKTRDARRLVDVQQIMTALELFFNDNGHYPLAKNGLPDPEDGNPKFSTLMSTVPNAPTPPDGDCSAQDNYYWYEQLEDGQNYRVAFCLGYDTNGIYGGKVTAGLSGISSGSGISKPFPEKSLTETLNDMPFTAVLDLDIELSNLNGAVQIEEPSGAVDYYQRLDEEVGNSAELANFLALQMALTEYFESNQKYPAGLGELSLSPLPQPTNTSGICAGIGDTYNYQPSADGLDYSFEFCFTADFGGYASGKHRVSALKGIE